MARRKSRILAFQAVYAWEAGSADESNLFEFAWASPALLERMGDDGLTFSRLIISGTIAHVTEIDAVISKHLVNWEFSRLNKIDLAILRISVYALLYQSDIHASITIDEAVDISREFGTDEAFRFINGILGAIKTASSVTNESAGQDVLV